MDCCPASEAHMNMVREAAPGLARARVRACAALLKRSNAM